MGLNQQKHTITLKPAMTSGRHEDGVAKAGQKQAAADSRGSRTCVVCEHLCGRWHMQGGRAN